MVLWRHQCLDSQIYLNWKLEAKEWHSIFCFWSPHSPDLNPENVWHVLNSVSRKVLSWQAYFRRDKHVFVTTNYVFCHDKSMLVSIKLLSQQTRVCRDKYFPGNFFVATKILSRQTILSRQRFLFCFCFCRDKNHTCGSSRQWHCQRLSSVQSLCKSLPRQCQHVLRMEPRVSRHWSDCPYSEVRFVAKTSTVEVILSIECIVNLFLPPGLLLKIIK